MKDYDNKRCYLCGSQNADSVDHVPPRNLFLKKYRKVGPDLITIPAHSKCNKKYEKDDEYFRYCILVATYRESNRARELWDTKIKKQIHRSESEGFRRYLIEKTAPVEIQTPSGLYLGDSRIAYLDVQRMDGLLERTARGIYYKKTKMIMPLDLPVRVAMMKPEVKRGRILNESAGKFNSIADGIFKYAWEHEVNDDKNGMFWFVFLDCVDFWIFTGSLANRTDLIDN